MNLEEINAEIEQSCCNLRNKHESHTSCGQLQVLQPKI